MVTTEKKGNVDEILEEKEKLDISTEDEQDKVSAKGFALGYVGSPLLLILNLIVILFPESFGIPKEYTLPARIAFLAVGIWWFGFAQYTFYYMPKNRSAFRGFSFDVVGPQSWLF